MAAAAAFALSQPLSVGEVQSFANGAVKLHTQMDLSGSIPVRIRITDGSVQDGKFMGDIVFEPECIYVFDRGYIDFCRHRRLRSVFRDPQQEEPPLLGERVATSG